MKKRKKISQLLWALAAGFILLNIIAIFHAYKFTHFTTETVIKTESPDELTSFDKVRTLLFGINNPRPKNKKMPIGYSMVTLQSNKKIECWYFKNNKSVEKKGTVILFHGYSSEKSSLVDKAKEFERLNYNLLLVDFMGSGGSEGNQTTLGFYEAEEVETAYNYIQKQGENNIYLFGTSMGAVAIMKALADYDLNPNGIIIECPFGSMYETTCARFEIMNAPIFPMAPLLVFWGGVQNNFWAFGHNPTDYAKKIDCPSLILYGALDTKVKREEIDKIYSNLDGKKTVKIYENVGHENLMSGNKQEWIMDIYSFLSKH